MITYRMRRCPRIKDPHSRSRSREATREFRIVALEEEATVELEKPLIFNC